MPDVKRVMIIGLDCAEPSPRARALARPAAHALGARWSAARYGRLESVVPPITVPAWSCMMSSRTPGDLGIYGFRNRADHSYDGLFIANGAAVKEPRLWDIVGAPRQAHRSSLGVPGTYPAAAAQRRHGLVLPHARRLESQYTYPPLLRDEVEQVVGEYLFDCTNFRTEDKDDLLRQIYEMTDRRFKLAEHLLSTKPWELFAMVEMGTDRIHHGFWKDMDPSTASTSRAAATSSAILDYHVHVDGLRRRSCCEHADDETAVLVVSDHGAKRMDGGIRINEWLRQRGPARDSSASPTAARARATCGIDWSRTKAWGEGGYYCARSSSTCEGREPEGTIVEPADYERVRDELADAHRPRSRTTAGEPIATQRLPARGRLRRGQRRRARPDRPLRRPLLARRRHGRRRRGPPHVRERHRARTTPTTRRTAC